MPLKMLPLVCHFDADIAMPLCHAAAIFDAAAIFHDYYAIVDDTPFAACFLRLPFIYY
jgi:hypothetical protein